MAQRATCRTEEAVVPAAPQRPRLEMGAPEVSTFAPAPRIPPACAERFGGSEAERLQLFKTWSECQEGWGKVELIEV
eukprot:2491907-Alexandrium_andersonii.AAC.1